MTMFEKITSRLEGFRTDTGVYIMEKGSNDMVFVRNVDIDRLTEFLKNEQMQ